MGATLEMELNRAKWCSHPPLRLCSIGARGLFAEVLALLHKATPKGAPVSAAHLATACRIDPQEVRALAAELAGLGLITCDGESISVPHLRRWVR